MSRKIKTYDWKCPSCNLMWISKSWKNDKCVCGSWGKLIISGKKLSGERALIYGLLWLGFKPMDLIRLGIGKASTYRRSKEVEQAKDLFAKLVSQMRLDIPNTPDSKNVEPTPQ